MQERLLSADIPFRIPFNSRTHEAEPRREREEGEEEGEAFHCGRGRGQGQWLVVSGWWRGTAAAGCRGFAARGQELSRGGLLRAVSGFRVGGGLCGFRIGGKKCQIARMSEALEPRDKEEEQTPLFVLRGDPKR